jgi:glutaryl-CoA dehydrogenase
MYLLCIQLGRQADVDKMTDVAASLVKMDNARKARRIVADARDILGGNGILYEYHVARHWADMEAVYTYEGTDSINSLIVGREITGHRAFS